MTRERDIDAIVRQFFTEWAHPTSYAGGEVNENSGKFEDRLNVGRISELYAQGATIAWANVVDGASEKLPDAIRNRVPFIANGISYSSRPRADGSVVVTVKGWITHDPQAPLSTWDTYSPNQGDQPFAERLVIDADGRISDDVFHAGATTIDDPEPPTVATPSTPDTAASGMAPDQPLSSEKSHPDVEVFLKQLYTKGGGFVSVGGTSYTDQHFYTDTDFFPFFLNGPARFWGKPSTANDMHDGVASPVSYTFGDWKIVEEHDGRLTVQVRVQGYASVTSTAAYYLDTLTLVRTSDAPGYKVDEQKRQETAAFRVF